MATLRRNPNEEFDKLRESAAKARLPYDKDSLLNLAYYLDQQYVEWSADWQTIRQLPREPGLIRVPRPVSNKIMHFVIQQHAYTLSSRPNPDVMPATDDPLDVQIAGPALAYLRYLADAAVGDYDGELSDQSLWALVAGEGYMKWTFNKAEKRPEFMSVNPLDIFTDPYAIRFRQNRYIIHSQFMDVQQIYDTWGVHVKPTQMDRADVAKAALLRDMGHAPVLEGAQVNELWLRPGASRKYPKGLLVIWTGKEQLLEPTEFPYEHGQLPFTQIGSVPRPGTQHYTCKVKFLRKPQAELNKYHQQRIMVREQWANPKWWIPNELELEADPNDSTGQILRGTSNNGSTGPEIIQPTTFPENKDGEWIRTEMQDVVGQHEVSQAQVPGRVEAAKAIELLRESDDSHLAELLRTIRQSTSQGFWQCLMLAKQFTPDEQIVQTYSREGMPEVKRFKAELVKPGMRVTVTMGTGLARSRAARADAALNMWQQGIIQDPETMAEILELPVGTIAPQRAFDIRLARNENLLIASGESRDGGAGTAVKPNSWDAHDIHLREHNNYRKTAEYEALPGDVKAKFEFHCQTHEVMQLQELMKEAKKQAVLQGAVMPPGPEDPNAAAPGGENATFTEAPPEEELPPEQPV
jgi:hypothetical protein